MVGPIVMKLVVFKNKQPRKYVIQFNCTNVDFPVYNSVFWMSRRQPIVANGRSEQNVSNVLAFCYSYLLFVIPDINDYGAVVNSYSGDQLAACTICCRYSSYGTWCHHTPIQSRGRNNAIQQRMPCYKYKSIL